MKEAKTDLIPLKDILAAVLSDPQLPFDPGDAYIWKVWDEVVGVTFARNAQPAWIKKGRLRVKVYDSIWLQELGFAENAIREKLNQRLGRKAIEAPGFMGNKTRPTPKAICLRAYTHRQAGPPKTLEYHIDYSTSQLSVSDKGLSLQ